MGYLRILTNSGAATLADDAAFDLSGNAEWRVDAAAFDWTPSAIQFLIDRYIVAGSNRNWRMRLDVDGDFLQDIGDGAGAFRLTGDQAWGEPANGARAQLRFICLADVGGTTELHLYTRIGAFIQDLESDSDWTLADSNTGNAGVQTWKATTNHIRLGSSAEAIGSSFIGDIYRAVHWSDATKTTKVFDVTFNNVSRISATEWNDAARTGHWTINGTENTDWRYEPDPVGGGGGFHAMSEFGISEFASDGAAEPEFLVEQAIEADVATDVVMRTEPRLVVEQGIEADVGTDVVMRTQQVLLVEQGLEADVATDVVLRTQQRFLLEQGVEADVAIDTPMSTNKVILLEQAIEADVATDVVLITPPRFAVEQALEADVATDVVLQPAPVFRAEGPYPHLRLVGTSGSNARTPTTTALDVTNDLDLLVRIDADTSIGNAYRGLIARRQSASAFAQVYALGIENTDLLSLEWTTAADVDMNAQATAIAAVQSGLHWLRANLKGDNGAGAYEAKFYYSTSNTDDPDAAVWTQIGSTVVGGSTTNIIDARSSQLEIAGYNDGSAGPWPAHFHRGIVRDGIGGTIIADFNADDFADGADAGDTAVDSTGKTWTLFGNAKIYEGGSREADVATDVVMATPRIFIVEQAVEADVAADVVFITQQVLLLEQAAEADVATDVVLETDAAQPVFNAEQAIEADAAIDVVFLTSPIFLVEQAAEADVAQEVTLLTVLALLVDQAQEADVATDVVLATQQVFLVESAAEADVAGEIALSTQQRLVVEQALEADVAADIVLANERRFLVEQGVEADVAQDATLATVAVLLVEQAAEADVAQDVVLRTNQVLVLDQGVEADSAQDPTLVTEPRFETEVGFEADVATDVAMHTAFQGMVVEPGVEADVAGEITLAVEQTFLLDQALEADAASDAGFSTSRAITVEQAAEADVATDVSFATNTRILVEQATEADVAQEISFIIEPSFSAEQAREADVAIDVILETTTPLVFPVDQGAEADVAFDVDMATVTAPSFLLDLATEADVAFEVEMATVFAPIFGVDLAVEANVAYSIILTNVDPLVHPAMIISVEADGLVVSIMPGPVDGEESFDLISRESGDVVSRIRNGVLSRV